MFFGIRLPMPWKGGNLELLFKSEGIPICETRPVYINPLMPWKGRIALHPLDEGKIEMLYLNPPKDSKNLMDEAAEVGPKVAGID